MGYKIGVDRKQLSLLPVSLDEYVPEDHICRLINAFTEQLNMVELGFKYAECKTTGCRPYDPRMMLNLYVYGYLHRVRSSRRLRDETKRNVEVMWLMEGLQPDDKTICNFRKDNAKTLKETFRAFSIMCRQLGLYGGEMVATDSVKLRANNSFYKNYNKTGVKKTLQKIDKKINEYMNILEQEDMKEEGESLRSTDIKAALEHLKSRKIKYEDLSLRIQNEGEISTVDPDARVMRSGGDSRRLDTCYNVQTVVDSKNHMVVDFEVTTCSSDAGTLEMMSEKAKELMGVEKIINLADAGYYDSDDIASCEENGVTCLVAKPATGGPKKAEGFRREDFIYDREKDVYICPCQKELKYTKNRNHISGRKYKGYVNIKACKNCPKKTECTKAKYREVLRLLCQDTLDVVDERVKKNRALYRKRQEIVEHVFGTIKAVWGYKQYLCRKKPKVTAETALTYMAYNLRRIFNIYRENGTNLAMAFA